MLLAQQLPLDLGKDADHVTDKQTSVAPGLMVDGDAGIATEEFRHFFVEVDRHGMLTPREEPQRQQVV